MIGIRRLQQEVHPTAVVRWSMGARLANAEVQPIQAIINPIFVRPGSHKCSVSTRLLKLCLSDRMSIQITLQVSCCDTIRFQRSSPKYAIFFPNVIEKSVLLQFGGVGIYIPLWLLPFMPGGREPFWFNGLSVEKFLGFQQNGPSSEISTLKTRFTPNRGYRCQLICCLTLLGLSSQILGIYYWPYFKSIPSKWLATYLPLVMVWGLLRDVVAGEIHCLRGSSRGFRNGDLSSSGHGDTFWVYAQNTPRLTQYKQGLFPLHLGEQNT